MIKLLLSITTIFFLVSCQQEKSKEQYMFDEASKNIHKYSNIQFANDKDVICKMKLSSGVSDTAHYKGQIYGFCCKFCKNDFSANPEHYLNKTDKE